MLPMAELEPGSKQYRQLDRVASECIYICKIGTSHLIDSDDLWLEGGVAILTGRGKSALNVSLDAAAKKARARLAESFNGQVLNLNEP
jgi:hypothetical protein